MLNKRIEILKTPGKQQSPIPSPSLNTNFPQPPPPPPPSKRHFQQQDIKSIPTATPSASSILPIDSTKVTIGKFKKIKYQFLFILFYSRNDWSKNSLCTSSTKCNN
jgi:hypothetical protein